MARSYVIEQGYLSESSRAQAVYNVYKKISEQQIEEGKLERQRKEEENKIYNLTANATSLLQNKKYSEAMRAYKDLLQKYPNNSAVSAAAYYGIGSFYYFGEKNYSAAIENYEKSISFDSNNPDIYKWLGLSYSGVNNSDKAIENFNKAISLNPKDHQSYYFAALVYVNLLKDYNKGAEYCEKATKIYPRQFDYFYILGCCYSYIKQDEKALEAFKFALKLKPNSKEAKAAIDAYKSRKN